MHICPNSSWTPVKLRLRSALMLFPNWLDEELCSLLRRYARWWYPRIHLAGGVDFICNYLGNRAWTLIWTGVTRQSLMPPRRRIGIMVQDWPGVPMDLHSCKFMMRVIWSLLINLRMRSPWSLRSWMERRVVIDFALYKNACDFDQQLPGYHYQIL